MEAELDAIIDNIRNPDCKRLLVKMLRHPKMRELYCTAPAAARLHQAYVSGLIEHTLVVVGHALAAAPKYDSVDTDVLVTGALLHDIGKVREYSWRRTIGYTDEGRLIGHVTLGGMMVDTAIRELSREPEGFSDRVRQHVLHLVMSHHGKMEWGAPVVPKTREAMLLHFADHMDAFMVIATDAMKIAAAKGDRWTNFQKMFDSYLFAETPADSVPAALPPMQAPIVDGGHPDDVSRQTSDSLWIPTT
jgi:3'-5' exoribonuclease